MCPREWLSQGLIARYWKDPHKFMPERFLGDWPRDAFMPFSQGKFLFKSVLFYHSRLLCRCPGLSGQTVRTIACNIIGIIPHKQVFRFAETEAVAVMTMLVSKYKVEVKEEPEFAGETFEERYARVLAFDQALTLS
jgi:hypothetical protein